MRRKILTLCMTVLLMLAVTLSVSAEELDFEKTGSIFVTLTEQYEKTPISGAELSLYHVAAVSINEDGALTYSYTDDFENTGIALDDPELAIKLDAYLSGQEMPAIKLRTDADGKTGCIDLPLGLYFIRQTNSVEGYAPCTPFLVTVPMQNGNEFSYVVNATPKTEVAKLTAITIRKVWNTDASTKAAESVTVQLLRNGKVVKTAILNEENNWQVTYTDMPESDTYKIQELDVPEGFTATYKQSGYVFTVTNTATLIQTGQVIWPIPVLAAAGVLLIALGGVLLQKKRGQHA